MNNEMEITQQCGHAKSKVISQFAGRTEENYEKSYSG
jgi:hypothetical protein